MLVERKALECDSKRLAARLRFTCLRQQATPEDVDHRAARGHDRALFQKLTGGEWIERHQDLPVTRPTKTGKTRLSCVLAHRACRDDRSVLYHPAAGGARHCPRRRTLCPHAEEPGTGAAADPGDDWAIIPLAAEQRRDLIKIVDDRHDRASTIIPGQVYVELWHEHIGNPTIADAVLDRLVHDAHWLELRGKSIRKLRAVKARLDEAAVQ